MRRSNGEDVLVSHGAARFTTQDLLDAEQRLLDHAHAAHPHSLAASQVDDFLAGFEERNDVVLDPGQRRLVHAFATDGRRLVVGIGPAGAGKTTAMKALTQLWRTTGRRVIPLAPSAAAADVLRDELGCRTENLHKFHHTHATGASPWTAQRPMSGSSSSPATWSSSTRPAWPPPGTSTGSPRMPANAAPWSGFSATPPSCPRSKPVAPSPSSPATPTPSNSPSCTASMTRPKHDATLAIRDGRADGLTFYDTHDRIRSGARHELLDQALAAWQNDLSAGRDTLLIAASTPDVVALNTKARASRVRTGAVEDHGIELADGTIAGVGDTGRHPTQRPTTHHPRRASLRQERRHLDRPPTAPRRRPHPRARRPAPRSACPTTTSPSTSSSATPPPPHAPKAAPSTPPTP